MESSAAQAPGGRWAARPWRARGVRVLVYALPLAGSLTFVRAVTALIGPPTSSLGVYLAWWFSLSVAATLSVSGIYALSRRLLPVGALLELSLVFPDEAPSRFRLAMRTGTVAELEERLRALHASPGAADPSEAAEILLQLVAALDLHDRITRGHAERVRGYAWSLGKELGLSRDDLDRLNWSALLHDIGKLEVSADILNKPGRPSDEEWEQLRRHPLYGETLVGPLRSWLGTWLDAVGYHHERWDGAGYPRGVAAEDIPLAGRIVAIADVFDVITSSRSYKHAATATQGREEITRCSGSQFDPQLVRAFVNMSLGRMRLVIGPVSWLTHASFLARLPVTPSFGAAFAGAATIATAAATGLALPHATALAQTAPPAAQSAAPHMAAPRTTATQVQPRSSSLLPAPHAPIPRAGQTVRPKRKLEKPTPTGAVPKKPAPPAAPTTTIASTTTKATTPTPSHDNEPAPAGAPRISPKTKSPPKPRPSPTHPAATPPPGPSSPGSTVPSPPATTTTKTTAPAPPPPTTTTAPPPPANVAPTFTSGGDQAVLEDAAPQTIAGFATGISPGPATESGQSVTFVVHPDNPGLFSAQPAITPDGTLTYSPAPNANGSTSVTVTAHDDGGTANDGSDTSTLHTFTITVTPVNDAPSFVPGGNQTAVSLLGAQTVSGWATGISPGPPDESGQSVTFVVTVDKPALFATRPAIAPDGTLTYKPNLLALGAATVTVRAVDGGGTANGGSNTSAAHTFTITIA